MPSYPGYLGPAYKGASFMADTELLINRYLEKNESPSAPNPWCELPCPGFNPILSVSQAPAGRGMFSQRGRAFFLAGFAFYDLLYDATTNTFSVILRGTVVSDGKPGTIHANGDAGNQLWITTGGVGYNFDLTSNVLSVEGVGGTTVTMGGFLDARFMYLDGLTGTLYASALYDGTTWDGSMLAQSESGDPWVALVVTPDNLIRLLGATSSECWANQGTDPFPWSQIKESVSPFGIVAPFAWSVDSTITWLAQNPQGRGVVMRAQGYSPVRLSTHAIENAIHGYGDLSDTTAWGYLENGHSFTMFTFPNHTTWVSDADSGMWHERAYWDVSTGTFQPYRIGCMMEAFGKTIVGDRLTGDIYEMNSTFSTDVNGAILRGVRQAPRLSFDQKRFTVDSLQLIMDTGQGLVTGQGSDPQMMVKTSWDGGQTFGNERWASTGKIGEWSTRVRWTQFGQGRNFVPQFVMTDPVPYRVVDCLVEYRVGSN